MYFSFSKNNISGILPYHLFSLWRFKWAQRTGVLQEVCSAKFCFMLEKILMLRHWIQAWQAAIFQRAILPLYTAWCIMWSICLGRRGVLKENKSDLIRCHSLLTSMTLPGFQPRFKSWTPLNLFLNDHEFVCYESKPDNKKGWLYRSSMDLWHPRV